MLTRANHQKQTLLCVSCLRLRPAPWRRINDNEALTLPLSVLERCYDCLSVGDKVILIRRLREIAFDRRLSKLEAR